MKVRSDERESEKAALSGSRCLSPRTPDGPMLSAKSQDDAPLVYTVT